MRQAIVTKYLPWTDTKGARIKASATCGNATVDFDSGKSVEENHWLAAQKLIVKLGWNDEAYWASRWVPGGNPDGTGNVYTCNDGDTCHLGQTAARPFRVSLRTPKFSIWADGLQQDYFATTQGDAVDLVNAVYVNDGYASFTKDEDTDPTARPSWSCEHAGVTFTIQEI